MNIRLSYCGGDAVRPPHYMITPPGHQLFTEISGPAPSISSLQSYLYDKFTIRVPSLFTRKSKLCYRKLDDKTWCNGHYFSVLVPVVLPIYLRFDFGPAAVPSKFCSMQKSLIPFEGCTIEGATYEYVGTVFSHNNSHFTNQFTLDGKSLYKYDDMKNGGRAMRTATSFSDQQLNEGRGGSSANYAASVIYQLAGGTEAQNRITYHQLSRLYEYYDIVLKLSNPVHSPDDYSVRLLDPSYHELALCDRPWHCVRPVITSEWDKTPENAVEHPAPALVQPLFPTLHGLPLLDPRRWPTNIDWSQVFPRLDALEQSLYHIVRDPSSHAYCMALAAQKGGKSTGRGRANLLVNDINESHGGTG